MFNGLVKLTRRSQAQAVYFCLARSYVQALSAQEEKVIERLRPGGWKSTLVV